MGLFRKSASATVDVVAITQECDRGCYDICYVGSYCKGTNRHGLVGGTQFLRIVNTTGQHVTYGRQALSGKTER